MRSLWSTAIAITALASFAIATPAGALTHPPTTTSSKAHTTVKPITTTTTINPTHTKTKVCKSLVTSTAKVRLNPPTLTHSLQLTMPPPSSTPSPPAPTRSQTTAVPTSPGPASPSPPPPTTTSTPPPDPTSPPSPPSAQPFPARLSSRHSRSLVWAAWITKTITLRDAPYSSLASHRVPGRVYRFWGRGRMIRGIGRTRGRG